MSIELIIIIGFIVLVFFVIGFIFLIYIVHKSSDSESESESNPNLEPSIAISVNIFNVLCDRVTSPTDFTATSGQDSNDFVGISEGWYVAQPQNSQCVIPTDPTDESSFTSFTSSNASVNSETAKGWAIRNDTDFKFDLNVLFVDTDKTSIINATYIQGGDANSTTQWTNVKYQGNIAPMYSSDQSFYITLYGDTKQVINVDSASKCLVSGDNTDSETFAINISLDNSGNGQVDVSEC